MSDAPAAGLTTPVSTMPDSVTIIIFGGAGDLAHRKLLPALYNLFVDGVLPARTAIVGSGRKEFTDEQYRAFAKDGIERFSRRPIDAAAWTTFAEMLAFVNLSLDDPTGMATLGSKLDLIEHTRGLAGNRLYYLAVPPSLFVPTVEQLARARFVGPVGQGPYARLVVEKPIGHDLASAMQINDALASVFDERETFRIDHYLGKETVQNILVLRFANSIFEPLFNQKYVDHVQITVAEQEGVGTRAGYYEQAGALRDMLQNHLLQLLSLVGMEPPRALGADVVRDEKLELLQSLRPMTADSVDSCVVRGQYGAGTSDGAACPAYRDEPGVSRSSQTETFVAMQLFIDNWRWAGVPFFLRTGKRMPARASEIAIQLKDVPPILFNTKRQLDPNVLTIRLQPDDGFSFLISSKVPGPHVRVQPVEMDFDYSDHFQTSSPEAYERLLLDVISGDATLFMRRDSVEASWQWIAPILDRWIDPNAPAVCTYPSGDWGPIEAARLIERGGRRWRTL